MSFLLSEFIGQVQELVGANAIVSNRQGIDANVATIHNRLMRLGFSIDVIQNENSAPILIAFREAKNSNRTLGLYNHYDVEPTNFYDWRTDPLQVKCIDDRLFARGIADNLGVLTLRLMAVEQLLGCDLPNLFWIFQGEEEIGSPFAHHTLPIVDKRRVDLWFEETGYFDLTTSRQRYLTLHADIHLKAALAEIQSSLAPLHFSSYEENRSLTKFDRCPFLEHVVADTPYLAIGPNDEYSNIHQPNESISIPLLETSFNQFIALLKLYV